MSGTDTSVGVSNYPSSGAQVDASALTDTANVAVVRQRVAIGDQTNANAFFDIDSFARLGRRQQEIEYLAAFENAINGESVRRGNERPFFVDRRGSLDRASAR